MKFFVDTNWPILKSWIKHFLCSTVKNYKIVGYSRFSSHHFQILGYSRFSWLFQSSHLFIYEKCLFTYTTLQVDFMIHILNFLLTGLSKINERQLVNERKSHLSDDHNSLSLFFTWFSFFTYQRGQLNKSQLHRINFSLFNTQVKDWEF